MKTKFIAVLLAAIVGSAWGNVGQLNSGFGSNGNVSVNVFNSGNVVKAALPKSNTVAIIGDADNYGAAQMLTGAGGAVMAFNGGALLALLPGSAHHLSLDAVAILKSGKLLVAGRLMSSADATSGRLYVNRIGVDGVIDGAFSGGEVVETSDPQLTRVNHILERADGTIVLAATHAETCAALVTGPCLGYTIYSMHEDGSNAVADKRVATSFRSILVTGIAEEDGKFFYGTDKTRNDGGGRGEIDSLFDTTFYHYQDWSIGLGMHQMDMASAGGNLYHLRKNSLGYYDFGWVSKSDSTDDPNGHFTEIANPAGATHILQTLSVQPDQKALLVGVETASNGDKSLVVYRTAGKIGLDNCFGTAGKAKFPVPTSLLADWSLADATVMADQGVVTISALGKKDNKPAIGLWQVVINDENNDGAPDAFDTDIGTGSPAPLCLSNLSTTTTGSQTLQTPPTTVSGFTGTLPINISNAEYRLNNGTWTSTAGTVQSGDVLEVRATVNNNTVTVTLTIGSQVTTFTVKGPSSGGGTGGGTGGGNEGESDGGGGGGAIVLWPLLMLIRRKRQRQTNA